MAVTKVPAKYEAGDGKKFPTAEEAERHDEAIRALNEYERALKRLCATMAKDSKTADGVPFEFRWGQYWFLAWYYGGGPSLRSVSIDRYQTTFGLDESERLELRMYTEDRGVIRLTTYRIGDLYDKERNAANALVEAMKNHIAEKQAELDELTSKG